MRIQRWSWRSGEQETVFPGTCVTRELCKASCLVLLLRSPGWLETPEGDQAGLELVVLLPLPAEC